MFYAETACIDHHSHKAIKIFGDKKHIEQPHMKSVSLLWLTEEQCWKSKYITKPKQIIILCFFFDLKQHVRCSLEFMEHF